MGVESESWVATRMSKIVCPVLVRREGLRSSGSLRVCICA